MHLILLLLAPPLILWLRRRLPLVARVDGVVPAYLFGILLGQLAPVAQPRAEMVAALGVGLSLPLMLFSLNIRRALATMPGAIGAMTGFALIVMVAALICASLLPAGQAAVVAGMLTGTFVGSAPNLAQVALVLGVDQELLLLTQSADLVISGSFFVFTTALLIPALHRIPLAGRREGRAAVSWQPAAAPAIGPTRRLPGVLLAMLVLGLTAAAALLFPEEQRRSALPVLLCGLSLAAAAFPAVNRLPGTLSSGEFFFWFFCVAAGAMVDPVQLADRPPVVLLYGTALLILVFFLHLLLCRLLGIDREIWLVTMASGIFSPVMIAPIAARLGDRNLVTTGIITGLFGLAAGSLCGLAVTKILVVITG